MNETQGMRLSGLVGLTGGRLYGGDALFFSVSTDSRRLRRGDLFVALPGPRFDAHDYVAEACRRGAIAALVNRRLDIELPQLLVEDTRLALGRLGAAWRDRFEIPVIAVTGSNGKTTVKEMLASILRQCHRALVTEGNLNNEIGVPQTLLRLTPQHDYAVLELGASHPGDIDYLTRLVRPDVALITNVAAAHLAGFGDIDSAARAKGEIFNGLSNDGVAVLNGDDTHAGLWRAMLDGRRCLDFALCHQAAVSAAQLRDNGHRGSRFRLCTPDGEVDISLPLPGRHNVMNALAAAAAAIAGGIALQDVRQGLEAMRAVNGRLVIQHGIHGSCIIDDSYNANPASMRAALDVLKAVDGEKILVLGDMAELGDTTQALHKQLGREARASGIDRLYGVGDLAALTVAAFGPGGRHCADRQALIEALREHLPAARGAVTVLIKGSRSMAMERIVAALVVKDGAASNDRGGVSYDTKQNKLSQYGFTG